MNNFNLFKKKYLLNFKTYFEPILNRNGADTYKKKWERILKYKNLTNTEILIETGTYYGLTVNRFKHVFSQIFSIEIDTTLYNFNKYAFRNYKNINIIHGDSATSLVDILKNLKETSTKNKLKIIFWLDGHCSEGETGIGEHYSPLSKELQIIIDNLDFILPIFIIDDVRLFDNVKYPNLNYIKDLLTPYGYNFIIDGDGLICIKF